MKNGLWEKFYECECHTELIVASYINEDSPPQVELAFFEHGYRGNLSFKERIRWCWYILRKGRPFTDMVVFSQDTAEELGHDLLSFSMKRSKNKKVPY